MNNLVEGNTRFVSNSKDNLPWDTATIAKGQAPGVTMITCSDSRVVPSLFTDTGVGDVFMLRNAGNAVGDPGTGTSEEASLAYAMDVLKTPHLVICGHTHCGAVGAAAAGTDGLDASLQAWVKNVDISGAKEPAMLENVWANAKAQCERVKKYPAVARALEEGRVQIHAWCYDIESGKIWAHNADKGTFEEVSSGGVA